MSPSSAAVSPASPPPAPASSPYPLGIKSTEGLTTEYWARNQDHFYALVRHLIETDNLPAPVLPGLFIGSVGAATNTRALKSSGVTHVLSMAEEVAADPDADFPFQFRLVAIDDVEEQNILQHADEVSEFIETGRANGGILVHCFAGVSRCATAICMYLIKKQNMSLPEALHALRKARPIVNPNKGFIRQLTLLEAQVRKGLPLPLSPLTASPATSPAAKLTAIKTAPPTGSLPNGPISPKYAGSPAGKSAKLDAFKSPKSTDGDIPRPTRSFAISRKKETATQGQPRTKDAKNDARSPKASHGAGSLNRILAKLFPNFAQVK